MALKLDDLKIKENWNQKYLDWQTGTRHAFPSYSPIYSLNPKDLGSDEKIMLKIPVELRLQDKQPHDMNVEGMNDLVKMLSQFMTQGRYIEPYTSYLYDGVLFVTNKRLLIRFISSLISYNCEYPLIGTTLSLQNKMDISSSFKKEVKVDPLTSMHLRVGDVDLWLLEGFRKNKSGGTYTFARFSVYSSLFEAVDYLKSHSSQGDDKKWRSIVKYLYYPDKQDKVNGFIILFLVLMLPLSFIILFFAGFLASIYESASFAIPIGFILFFGSFFSLFLYALLISPLFEKRLQKNLAAKDQSLSQYLNKR